MKKLLSFLAIFPLLAACANTEASSLPRQSLDDPYREIEYALAIDGAAGEAKYDASKVEKIDNHPLNGKTIYWLGSSVTYGSAASGMSMADYLSAKTGAICVKEAVSGTTIFDDGGSGDSGAKSYTRRLLNSSVFDTKARIDAFICQISTNDCTSSRLSKRGAIADSNLQDYEDFDRSTTLGGIEFIISYVNEIWGCPIYFYSGAKFGDGSDKAHRQNSNPKGSDYGQLVSQTLQICAKWDKLSYVTAGVIDLYNDEEFNAKASDEYYAWAMNDPIHPKKAGYLQWWMPYFENYLIHAL